MLPKYSFAGYITRILQLDPDEDAELIETIFGLCIRHICKCDRYTTFNKAMKNLLDFNRYDFSESDFRGMIRENGYLLTSVKYYALAYASGRNCPERAEQMYPQYDMYRCDAKIIKNIYEEKGFKSRLLRETEFDTSKESISPYALAEAVDKFVHVLPVVTKHAKVLRKKVTFITSSNNFQKNEFESEFIAQALRAYYYTIPTKKDGLELENYLRASMSKHQINIISANTTQSRQRMVNAGKDEHGNDKFVMNLVSQSQLNGFSEEGEEIDFDGILTESLMEKQEREQFFMSVDRLILKNIKSRKRPKRQQAELLAIFTGRPNENFENYLRERNLLRSDLKGYSDFIDEKPREVYLEEISNYMDVSVDRILRNLRLIGKQLALNYNGDYNVG